MELAHNFTGLKSKLVSISQPKIELFLLGGKPSAAAQQLLPQDNCPLQGPPGCQVPGRLHAALNNQLCAELLKVSDLQTRKKFRFCRTFNMYMSKLENVCILIVFFLVSFLSLLSRSSRLRRKSWCKFSACSNISHQCGDQDHDYKVVLKEYFFLN